MGENGYTTVSTFCEQKSMEMNKVINHRGVGISVAVRPLWNNDGSVDGGCEK